VQADWLNEHCGCVSTDAAVLSACLERDGLAARMQEGAFDAHVFFANHPVFVDARTLAQIESLILAVQVATSRPAFVESALVKAPAVAAFDAGTHGIVHGFDFHLTDAGPKLIEINTNAGGLLLAVAQAEAQRACCDAVAPHVRRGLAESSVRDALIQGFRSEFALSRGSAAKLESVAIIDEAPASQFLYPEFLLFRDLFRSHGIDAWIAEPRELEHRDGGLFLGEHRIDLVYNRLTDFYFDSETSRALRAAHLAKDVVVTPSPRHHALLANKRHLATLSNASELRRLGVPEEEISILTSMVPEAELVRDSDRESLVRRRKDLFFKPLAGYGSKAAYRGDKLTRGKLDEILAGDYLAQRVVAPSERTILVDGQAKRLKVDVRAYVVEQKVLLFAARLYQGQTSNFRTQGGGFASILRLPEANAPLAAAVALDA
jgi:hypothetical protein